MGDISNLFGSVIVPKAVLAGNDLDAGSLLAVAAVSGRDDGVLKRTSTRFLILLKLRRPYWTSLALNGLRLIPV